MAVTSVSTIAARSTHEVDPFSVEVVRQGLASIAEEMILIVMRAARSPVLREAGDLSSAITDARGGIIAQGRDLPVHLGVMAFTVKALIKHVGQQNIRYGDVWIVNHPEVGGNHLPDVKVIRPIFHGSKLIAFGISLAHWADVGGGTPGSYNAGATDAWQEGLMIPPVRLMQQNEVHPEIMSFIKANVRGDSEREGDILAQAACCMLADKRVNELVDRLGLETFLEAVAQIHEVSEQQVKRILSSIPDGSYHGEDFIDGDGRGGPPVKIAVDITIRGDQAVFDFSNSGDSILAPLNTTALVCQTSVIYVLKSISKEEVFHSDGCFRPLEVITRRGSIIDPLPGYPLAAGNHETSQRIVDAVIRALSAAIPERICAGGSGTAGLLIFSAATHGDNGGPSTKLTVAARALIWSATATMPRAFICPIWQTPPRKSLKPNIRYRFCATRSGTVRRKGQAPGGQGARPRIQSAERPCDPDDNLRARSNTTLRIIRR